MPAYSPTLTPRPLRRDDRIAIVSPAGIIKADTVHAAIPVLNGHGWDVTTGPHAFDRYSTYAGTDADRLADLTAALLDPSVRAVLCSRGGYGAVHLLESLDRLPLRDDPKWIIGYSDISVLHALMARKGIESIHAPMCKHIGSRGADDVYVRRLFDLLEGRRDDVVWDAHQLNSQGQARGQLLGGNLAVIAGLIDTPYDVFRPGTILFIEDIAEPVYKTERILYNLRLSGRLQQLGALVVGRFTDYAPGDENMEQMIARMTAAYGYPVAFGMPLGHVDDNTPLVSGALVNLSVTPDNARITYND